MLKKYAEFTAVKLSNGLFLTQRQQDPLNRVSHTVFHFIGNYFKYSWSKHYTLWS